MEERRPNGIRTRREALHSRATARGGGTLGRLARCRALALAQAGSSGMARPRRNRMAAVVAAVCLAAPAVASAEPQLPSTDPFYAPPVNFAAAAPGTVMRTRSTSFVYRGATVPVRATQVLYRTSDQLLAPAATVATVLVPQAPNGNIVSYQEAYDDLGGSCDPSYTLQGGNSGETVPTVEHGVISSLLAAGDTVVDSDYEGENLAYGAGQQAGYQTLDGIRAAEKLLNLNPVTTKVGMTGYSGGSIASEYAAELAPSYAPELNFVGTAIGGIPADFAHNLLYINGSASYSDVMPAIFVGVARAFHINLKKYLSPLGKQLTKQDSDKCIASYLGARPGLKYQELLKPRYQEPLANRTFVRILNRLTMSYSGTPKQPLYMAVGNSDGTGDTVMIAADVEGLAHVYCQRGVSVEFQEYQHMAHGEAGAHFFPIATEWLTQRFNGVPASDGCGSIGPGNSLALLPERHKHK
jgi:Secretory lipase